MAGPSPNAVASWMMVHCGNAEFAPVQEAIAVALRSKMEGLSGEGIAELAESLESNVIKRLHEMSDEFKADGIEPQFTLVTERSTNHIKFIERAELVDQLRLLRDSPPDQFEEFCVRILRALGADAVRVGGNHDGGVDFEAFDLPLGPGEGPSPIGARALVIGQAKRYGADGFVSEKELREFIGAATRKSFLLRMANKDRVGIVHPTAYAYWTTSDFHRAAKIFAKEMGIWYLGGHAIVQLAMKLDVRVESV